MGLLSRWTFILLLCFCQNSHALDDLKTNWTFDLLYHYSRIERATTILTDSFLSRQVAMLQFEYSEHFGLFSRWYAGGDLTYALYEAAGTRSLNARENLPWQYYAGLAFQMGALKNFEVYFGIGNSTENYLQATGSNQFRFKEKISFRPHLGFHWRFISLVGSTATFGARYMIPITTVSHDGIDLVYKGVLDGTLRLRFHYDSMWSLYGGIRFEDYETVDKSITYFTTRIYAGIGIHL